MGKKVLEPKKKSKLKPLSSGKTNVKPRKPLKCTQKITPQVVSSTFNDASYLEHTLEDDAHLDSFDKLIYNERR